MGKIDEHWCNVCKRTLDKGKDKYVEFELVNIPLTKKVKQKLKGKKGKGIICQDCIDKNPELKKAVELMVKAGNPTFSVAVVCFAYDCEDFIHVEGSKYPRHCGHISVIGDTLYCKRSHPGKAVLTQEVAEVERFKNQLILEELTQLLKDPNLVDLVNKVMLEKKLENVHIPPSNIVPR